MAANSKRELIILDLVAAVTALTTIKSAERKMLSESELKLIPATNLPYVAVIGKLPKQQSVTADKKQFRSLLDVQMIVYALNNATPDSTISSLADDMWRVIMADPERRGLAKGTTILPDMPSGIFAPYCVFAMTAQVEYMHTNQQI